MKNPLQGANTQMADPNAEPTIPQPAATVLLVRDSKEEGVEVFLVERASRPILAALLYFLVEKWILKMAWIIWR